MEVENEIDAQGRANRPTCSRHDYVHGSLSWSDGANHFLDVKTVALFMLVRSLLYSQNQTAKIRDGIDTHLGNSYRLTMVSAL